MKNFILRMHTLLVALVAIGTLQAQDVTTEVDDITYLLNTENMTATVSKGSRNLKGEITIPGKITYEDATYTVTEIGASAFTSRSPSMTAISLPESVTTIGMSAFTNSKLTRVDMPGVTTIEARAFSGCRSLTSVSFPCVTDIGPGAFGTCNALEEIALPEGLTRIGMEVFYNCSKLNNVVWPQGVTVVPERVFWMCTGLTDITLPETLTAIETRAFMNTGLTAIDLPKDLTAIGEEAFVRCDNLRGIICHMENPQQVTVAATAWENSVFENAILYVRPGTSGAYQATEVWKNFKTIAEGLNLTPYTQDGVTYLLNNDTHTATITDATDAVNSLNIPEQLTYNDETYTVTAVKNRAFANNTGLNHVVWPKTITTIPAGVFSGCSALNDITLPEGLTAIGEHAFSNSGLETITLPQSLTDIGNGAFGKCTSLNHVVWPQGITTIKENTFYGCSALNDITLPEGLTAIGEYAFSNSGLKTITLPQSLTDIESRAFYSCASLNHVVWPQKVTTIKGFTFYGCSALSDITLPEGLTAIGEYAFSNSGLATITLPQSLTDIGSRAFEACTSLNHVLWPQKVTTIKGFTFYGCSALSDITLPEGLTTISESAFRESGLETITLPQSLTNIEASAFEGCRLQNILCHIASPQEVTVSETAWNKNTYDYTLFVKPGTAETYRTADVWGNFKTITEGLNWSTCTIDGIGYWLNNDTHTAAVSGADRGVVYLNIPEQITHDNTTYTVTTIKNHAISGFPSGPIIKIISLPQTIKSIEYAAFSGAVALADLFCHITNPQSVTVDEHAWATQVYLCNMHVHRGSADLYRNMSGWNKFKNISEGLNWSVSEPIDGIAYLLDHDTQTAGVSYAVVRYYPVIKPLIEHNGVTYKVVEIRKDAFYSPTTGTILNDLVLPETITSIGSGAFGNCQLWSITLPQNLTYISDFAFSSCWFLNDIYCYVDNPQDIEVTNKLCNSSVYNSCILHVKPGRADAYRNAEVWKNFANIVEDLTSGVENVADDADITIEAGDNNLTLGGDAWTVCTTDGRTVVQGSGRKTLNLPSGIYVIRCGNTVKKIYIK